jgi:hypothetical protein
VASLSAANLYMTVVTSGVATAYPVGATEFTLVFSGIRVAQFVVFCVVFCRSLFVLFLLTICIVLYFDLQKIHKG